MMSMLKEELSLWIWRIASMKKLPIFSTLENCSVALENSRLHPLLTPNAPLNMLDLNSPSEGSLSQMLDLGSPLKNLISPSKMINLDFAIEDS